MVLNHGSNVEVREMMKEEEIVRIYKESKDRKRQIQILADLNCCTRKNITEVLKSYGFIYDEKRRVYMTGEEINKEDSKFKKIREPKCDIMDREVYELRKQGMTYREISLRYGCSAQTISNRCKKVESMSSQTFDKRATSVEEKIKELKSKAREYRDKADAIDEIITIIEKSYNTINERLKDIDSLM